MMDFKVEFGIFLENTVFKFICRVLQMYICYNPYSLKVHLPNIHAKGPVSNGIILIVYKIMITDSDIGFSYSNSLFA